MSKRPFDYHNFLTKLKLYVFETVSAAIVIGWLIQHAFKELWPTIHEIWRTVTSP